MRKITESERALVRHCLNLGEWSSTHDPWKARWNELIVAIEGERARKRRMGKRPPARRSAP